MNSSTSSSTLPERKNYNTIQVLRFIAALMVVICHSTFFNIERLEPSLRLYDQGAYGVELFFVISGFVMLISSEGLKDKPNGWRIFAVKRILRIVPIYWIITSYKVLILLFGSALVYHAKLDVVYIIKSYFFIPAMNVDGKLQPFYGVGWTLNFEMFFYLLFTLSLALRIRPMVFLGTIFVLLAGLSFYKNPAWPDIRFYADLIVLNFLYGMIIAKLILMGKKMPQKLALAVIVLGLLYTFLPRTGFLTGLYATVDTVGIASFLIIYAAASIDDIWGQKIPAWLVYLGGASYSLYLVHPSVAPLPPTIFKILKLHWPLISVISSVVLSVILGTIFYRIIETPITRITSKFAKRKNLI